MTQFTTPKIALATILLLALTDQAKSQDSQNCVAFKWGSTRDYKLDGRNVHDSHYQFQNNCDWAVKVHVSSNDLDRNTCDRHNKSYDIKPGKKNLGAGFSSYITAHTGKAKLQYCAEAYHENHPDYRRCKRRDLC